MNSGRSWPDQPDFGLTLVICRQGADVREVAAPAGSNFKLRLLTFIISEKNTPWLYLGKVVGVGGHVSVLC